MNLRKHKKDDVDVNLTPLIDVVFLLLIFFMVSTTFERQSQINLTLPEASNKSEEQQQDKVEVAVDVNGRYFVNGKALINASSATLEQAIGETAAAMHEPTIIISADANAAHQSVVTVMDVARKLGYLRIMFATDVSATKR